MTVGKLANACGWAAAEAFVDNACSYLSIRYYAFNKASTNREVRQPEGARVAAEGAEDDFLFSVLRQAFLWIIGWCGCGQLGQFARNRLQRNQVQSSETVAEFDPDYRSLL